MVSLAIKGALASSAGAVLLTVDPTTVQATALQWIAVATALALAAIAGYTKVVTALHDANVRALQAQASSDANAKQLNGALDARISAAVNAALLDHERVMHSGATSSGALGAVGVPGPGGVESTPGRGAA